MEKDTTPGIDGLPVEFDKSHWSVLAEALLDVLNDSVAWGKVPPKLLQSCTHASSQE